MRTPARIPAACGYVAQAPGLRRQSLLPVLLALALLTGCGYVGEPLYPALNIPSRVGDLTAVERGDKLEIDFTIPPVSTEGLALIAIGSIELRVGPNNAPAFQADQWAAEATRIDVSTPSQPGAVHAEIAVRDFIGKEVLVAARVSNAKGRMSAWSNIAIVAVQPPLTKPVDFKAAGVPEGVRLSWSAPNEGTYRIYRRTGEEKTPSILGNTDKLEYLDATTEYGKTYEYYVQGVRDKAESEVAGLPEPFTPKDTFPPAVPTGLTASAGVDGVELAWERNTELDFKGYRVYRSMEDGPVAVIAEMLEAPSYSDKKIESGKRYRYRVTAVDQSGNESKPSEPADAVAP